jgi:oligoribonuclease
MTGLAPEKERIIEIATLITDSQLNYIAEGPNIIINSLKSFLMVWMNGTKSSTADQA